uniref:Endonuclease/exonuclease/phosphatase domain-containing protein n=2 Tax=Caenorhabditis japonica TaxID=281687 RepID=A0A8R1EQR9_CAEJA
MLGRSTITTEIYKASYGPKNRRKGDNFHIISLISDQSKAEAFDLLAVNSGCKVIALQEMKRKEGEWAMSNGAERKESQSDKFYKDMKKVNTRISKWDSSIIICGDFNAVVGCSSGNLPFVGGHGTRERSENGDRRGSAGPRGRPPKRWADDIIGSIKIFTHNKAFTGNHGPLSEGWLAVSRTQV